MKGMSSDFENIQSNEKDKKKTIMSRHFLVKC